MEPKNVQTAVVSHLVLLSFQVLVVPLVFKDVTMVPVALVLIPKIATLPTLLLVTVPELLSRTLRGAALLLPRFAATMVPVKNILRMATLPLSLANLVVALVPLFLKPLLLSCALQLVPTFVVMVPVLAIPLIVQHSTLAQETKSLVWI